MVGRILRHFADMSDTDMATAIANALECIGEFTGVEQSYLVEMQPLSQTIQQTHRWCVYGNDQNKNSDHLQHLIPLWLPKLQEGVPLYIPLVENLPEHRQTEKMHLQEKFIRSSIVMPLMSSDRLHGVIGFESIAQPRLWDDVEITLLRSVADIIVGGLIRTENHTELMKKEHQFRLLMQHSFDVVTVIDSQRKITYASGSIYALLGSEPHEWIGNSYKDVIHPQDLLPLANLLQTSTPGTTLLLPDFRIRNIKNEYHWFSGKATDFRNDSIVNGWIINAHDITLRKNAEHALQHQAYHDPLTGLSNRALLLKRMLDINSDRPMNSKNAVGILFIDLDHFKIVNDSLGHDIGDQLLVDVAKRLKEKAHPTDTVARFGGDEFVVLIGEHANTSDSIIQYAYRFLEAFEFPFTVKDRARVITASGGVVIANEAWNPGALLRDADAAMYQAKSKGRNRIQIFDAKMQQILLDKVEIANDLRHSEQRGELYLMYQPVYNIDGVTLKSVEALLRWNHPQRGLISPVDFIPVAEDTGMIIPIGVWVLNEALSQMRKWLDEFPGLSDFGIAVNLSTRQLAMPQLAALISAAMTHHRIGADRLTIELTESSLMADLDDSLKVLRELRDLGCKIAIDDFGTGYSSMAYLRDLPATCLKIDRSFVSQILRSERDKRIVAAMVNIANELDMQTVAEGVEYIEQIEALRDVHCTNIQGYVLMKPSLPENIEPLLKILEKTHLAKIKQNVPTIVIKYNG